MMSGAARAQEEEDDDKTFEEKIIGNIMAGIGATNMENRGIDYRERSPLVVPPKLDLPPPASPQAAVPAPNWPKDPDMARRKAAIAARKKDNKDPVEAARVLTPNELNVARTAPGSSGGTKESDSTAPGVSNATSLSPSQLGYTGGLMNMFHGNSSEVRDVHRRADPGFADPAAGRLPDAVAELRLRHRPQAIAEQEFQRNDGKDE